MNHIKKNAVILIILLGDSMFSLSQGFVLDSLNRPKSVRKYCTPERINKDKSPIQESIERGACESFAETVGLVFGSTQKDWKEMGTEETLSSGTATLIRPNIILTAAHVVAKCREDSNNCSFILNGAKIAFKTVYIPKEYDEFLNLKKRLKELKKLDEIKIYYEKEEDNLIVLHEIIRNVKELYAEEIMLLELKSIKDNELGIFSAEQIELIGKLNLEESSKLDDEIRKVQEKVELLKKEKDIFQEKHRNLEDEIRKLKSSDLFVEFEEIKEKIKKRTDHDISIVVLKNTPTTITNSRLLSLKYDPIDLPDNKTQTFFGVSVNRIVDNITGNKINDTYYRHIAIFNFKKENQNDRNFTSLLTLPDDYNSLSCQLASSGKPQKVPTRFNYDPSQFLMGAVQLGDSGGPLVGKFGRDYKIIGVTKLIDYEDCFNFEINGFIPGKSYKNQWTLVSFHKDWIEKTLQNY